MVEIDDIFSAAPKSNWDFMTEREQCFYIPAYQRHFSWAKEHIDRLIEDTAHGLLLLPEQNDSIKFLGTIIAINDKQHQTIDPKVKDELPPKVMTIIDGQQRLSTILLINCVLHNEISLRHKKIKLKDGVHFKWLTDSSFDTAKGLFDTLEIDRGRGELQYYPKMIRAFVDQWSRKASEASYTSPLSYYLSGYCAQAREKVSNYKHQLPDCDGEDLQYHEYVGKIHRAIRSALIGGIAQQKVDDRFHVPSFSDIASSKKTQEALFLSEFPDDVKVFLLQADENSDENKDFSELFRLSCFANYFMRRVCITIVTADSEDYAFDMFEALNTTGEPLTAFETFKPSVIKAETMQEYRDSPSHDLIENIDSYLRHFSDTTKRHKATSELLIPFALAEDGTKLSKRLSEQRRFMRDSFDAVGDEREIKRDYVKHLSQATSYVRGAWNFEKADGPKLPHCPRIETPDVKLCLDYLKQAKHSVTQALLIRFYSKILNETGDARIQAEAQFVDALKAVSTFFTFWRGSRSNTGGIDSVYRDILGNGVSALGIGSFCRTPTEGKPEVPDVEKLQQCFRHFLADKGNISKKSDWVRLVSRNNVFETRQIARFILLAAFDDVVPDAAHPGLIKKGRENVSRSLAYDIWRHDSASTLEHIAPQRPEDGWLDELYGEDDVTHTLGNLTLLPLAENASLGNRPWMQKKAFYSILSSTSVEEVDQKIIDVEAMGLEIAGSTKDLLRDSCYIPYVAALAEVGDSGWTRDIIVSRSTRIAELCWDRLAPWLGYK